jgi:hypothetical protein
MLGASARHAPWDYLAPVGDIPAQFFRFFVVDVGNLVDAVMADFWPAFAAFPEIIVHHEFNSLVCFTRRLKWDVYLARACPLG